MTIPAAKVLAAEAYAAINNKLCALMLRAKFNGHLLDAADLAYIQGVLRGAPTQGGEELEERAELLAEANAKILDVAFKAVLG